MNDLSGRRSALQPMALSYLRRRGRTSDRAERVARLHQRTPRRTVAMTSCQCQSPSPPAASPPAGLGCAPLMKNDWARRINLSNAQEWRKQVIAENEESYRPVRQIWRLRPANTWPVCWYKISCDLCLQRNDAPTSNNTRQPIWIDRRSSIIIEHLDSTYFPTSPFPILRNRFFALIHQQTRN